MKVCYVDESSNATQDPCLIMVGILVDSSRLHRTQREFAKFFDLVQGLFAETLRELKGSKMLFGRDRWRKVNPDIRKQIISYFCDWIAKRKHRLIVTGIDRAKLKGMEKDGQPAERRDEWLAAALHVALQIQKVNYAEIEDYDAGEEWPGEKASIDGYVVSLAERLLPKPARWPAHTGSSAAKWFNDIAPPSLKALGYSL